VSALGEDCVAATEVERLTGFAATDISRIRNVSLSRFSADRLLTILFCLGRQVEVVVQYDAIRERRG